MISYNAEEAEICKRRRHSIVPSMYWKQCQWCGTWLRTVSTVQARIDEPPAAEIDPWVGLQKMAESIAAKE